MMKNDYRRSLIMLRTHVQGYSGHVRLERRTLMGTMYMVINASGEGSTLCASLVRRNNQGEYMAVKLGELRRDGRGQASLAYSFDPRNIEGVPLEDYWLIVIVARNAAGACAVALSGNVNGSKEVDWSAVQMAACAACSAPRPPISIPPRPSEALPKLDVPAAPGEGPLGTQTPTVSDGEPAQPEEGPEQLPTPSLPNAQPSEPDDEMLEMPTPKASVAPEATPSDSLQPADELPEDVPLQTAFAPEATTAAELLGLDASVRWPGVAEQVREYFLQPPQEMTLDDGYIYVTAPMPADSGYDHVEVGLKAQSGVPISVAYALPSSYTPEPPQGLENYVWKGGETDGWWVIETDNYTGERIV